MLQRIERQPERGETTSVMALKELALNVQEEIEIQEASPVFTEIDYLRSLLGAPSNPCLFPPHFLKTTFPKIGGRIIAFKKDQELIGVGFLFPRSFEGNTREFTLRFHRTLQEGVLNREKLIAEAERGFEEGKMVFYDSQEKQRYNRTTQIIGKDIEIGRPDAKESLLVRNLQQKIWGSESDFLYPADIHSVDFHTATSLIARIEGKPVGFVFGFYKFGGSEMPPRWQRKIQSEFRLESQLLGVLPEYRRRGIAFLLKKLQAETAQKEGIDIVNWTVDPLQYGNAVLNFSRLGAVAFNFYPDYYPFRNELNQVAASRFEITWLVGTKRVRESLSSKAKATILDLSEDSRVRKINNSWIQFSLEEDNKMIAFEIPSNWTRLQRENPQEALRWREVTDTLFEHYLGFEEGRYIITGVGEGEGRRYLIAEKATPALLEKLIAK